MHLSSISLQIWTEISLLLFHIDQEKITLVFSKVLTFVLVFLCIAGDVLPN